MLGFGLIVQECTLQPFEAAASVVEDVRAGAEHEVVAADASIECHVDERAQRLDIKLQLVDLAMNVAHTSFCVERSAGKPASHLGPMSEMGRDVVLRL